MLLTKIGDGMERSKLERLLPKLFPGVTSTSTARGYVSVLVTLGLVEVIGHTVRPTVEGRRFRRSGDRGVLREALVHRVYGIEEILEELSAGPTTCPDLIRTLAERDVSWNHPMAVRYRVWWLVSTDAVRAKRQSRVDVLTVTKRGLSLLSPLR
jgi:hypothetical protein